MKQGRREEFKAGRKVCQQHVASNLVSQIDGPEPVVVGTRKAVVAHIKQEKGIHLVGVQGKGGVDHGVGLKGLVIAGIQKLDAFLGLGIHNGPTDLKGKVV